MAYSVLALARHYLIHPEYKSSNSEFSFGSSADNLQKISNGILPGFKKSKNPCHASTLSLDTCIQMKMLVFECIMLAACPQIPNIPNFPNKQGALDIFMDPPKAGDKAIESIDFSSSREVLHSAKTAELLRASGWQIWGSQRLALTGATSCLFSGESEKRSGTHESALSLLLLNIYHRFGFKHFLKISENEKMQRFTSINRVRTIIEQKRATYKRQTRYALKLATDIPISPKSDLLESIEQKVEVREAIALAYLSGEYYAEAEKVAHAGYTLAKNACLPIYALRLLLLIGRIHIESGSWKTGMPHICSVLEQYREMDADLIGAEAALYMAKIWSEMGSQYVDRSIEEIEAALPIILALSLIHI